MVDTASQRDEILARAKTITDASATYKVIEEEPHRKVMSFQYEGQNGMICFCTLEGMTLDKVKAGFEDPLDLFIRVGKENAANIKMQMTKLEEDNGVMLSHNQVDPGIMLVSQRSTFVWHHRFEHEGSFIYAATGVGSEAKQEQYKERIGKDVIGTAIINYMKFTPCEKGLECVHINVSNPNGSIPGFVVSKMIAAQGNALVTIAKILA